MGSKRFFREERAFFAPEFTLKYYTFFMIYCIELH